MGSRSKMMVNRPKHSKPTGQKYRPRFRSGDTSRTIATVKNIKSITFNGKIIESENFKVSRKVRKALYKLGFKKRNVEFDFGQASIFEVK